MTGPTNGAGQSLAQGPVGAQGLPIAVGLLRASAQLPGEPLEGAAFLGELSLDGALRHTPGMLPMVMVAREAGLRRVYVPSVDAHEAGLVDGVEVVPVAAPAGLVDQLRGHAPTDGAPPSPAAASRARDARPASDGHQAPGLVDFRHVRGQQAVKRTLEVAAAGGHNLLTFGSEYPRLVRARRALAHDGEAVVVRPATSRRSRRPL